MTNAPGWGPTPPQGPPPGPPYGGWGWGAPPPPKPGVIPLAPLGLDQILGGALATMRRYPGPLFGTIGTAYGLLLLLVAGAGAVAYRSVAGHLRALLHSTAEVPPQWADGRPVLVAFAAVWGIAVLLMLPVTAFTQAACPSVLESAVLGRATTVGAVFRRAASRTLPALGVLLLITLMVTVPWLLLAGGGGALIIAAASAGDGSGVAVASVLMVLVCLALAPLSIWLSVRFSLAPPAVVLESAGPGRALRRSAGLVRGAWWRIFGVTALAYGIVAVTAGAFRLPLMFVGPQPGLSPRFQEADTPGEVLSQVLPGMVVSTGLSLAVTLVMQIVFAAFVPLVTTLLYLDQRIRKEGLADQLAAAAG
ncbi:hypothetical protein [Streptomyces sp. NPDC058045]|uniref:DUF7847 domain-containing protein n=1 Tax=Streptomyces sp. NPDC058045 TaxID=3346311 RepID=UPI0036EFB794